MIEMFFLTESICYSYLPQKAKVGINLLPENWIIFSHKPKCDDDRCFNHGSGKITPPMIALQF